MPTINNFPITTREFDLTDLGLGQVNNTADMDKPVSTAQAAADAAVLQAANAATAAAIAAIPPAPSPLPTVAAATTTPVLDATRKVFANLTITGNTAITVSSSVPGAEGSMPVTANGTSTVTVSGAEADNSNMEFVNTNGTVNTLWMYNTGAGIVYAWSQRQSAAPAAPAPSPAVAPVRTAQPTVTGATTPGATLTRVLGTYTGTPTPTVAGIWRQSTDGGTVYADIGGATAATFSPTVDGRRYRWEETATNTGGTATGTSNAIITTNALTAPAQTTTPTISGSTTPGSTLTRTLGTYTGNPTPSVLGIWQNSADGTTWTDIPGQTSSTFSPTVDGQRYRWGNEIATNSQGSTSASNSNVVIAAAGGGGDADANAYIAAVTAAGGTVSAAAEAAYRTWLTTAKSRTYYSTLRRVNLMIGDATVARLMPQIAVGGPATDTNVGSTYAEATGMRVNGTTQYLNTGVNPPAATGDITLYLRTAQPSDTTIRIPMGARNATTQSYGFRANSTSSGAAGAGSVAAVYGGWSPGPYPVTTGGMTAALWHVSRTSPTEVKMFKNGTQVGSTVTTSVTASDAGFPVFVGAYNGAGTAANFPAANTDIGAYSIGTGMTDAQAAEFYTDMQAFQTAMGRNV